MGRLLLIPASCTNIIVITLRVLRLQCYIFEAGSNSMNIYTIYWIIFINFNAINLTSNLNNLNNFLIWFVSHTVDYFTKLLYKLSKIYLICFENFPLRAGKNHCNDIRLQIPRKWYRNRKSNFNSMNRTCSAFFIFFYH